MEKINQYQEAILKVLHHYAAIHSPFVPEVGNRVVADNQSHTYLFQSKNETRREVV